jgi:hypothetical protein
MASCSGAPCDNAHPILARSCSHESLGAHPHTQGALQSGHAPSPSPTAAAPCGDLARPHGTAAARTAPRARPARLHHHPTTPACAATPTLPSEPPCAHRRHGDLLEQHHAPAPVARRQVPPIPVKLHRRDDVRCAAARGQSAKHVQRAACSGAARFTPLHVSLFLAVSRECLLSALGPTRERRRAWNHTPQPTRADSETVGRAQWGASTAL